jgi:hypothetical protein
MRITDVAFEFVETENDVVEFAVFAGNEKLSECGAISNDSGGSTVATVKSVGVNDGAVGKLAEFSLRDRGALRISARCVAVCDSHSGVPENDYEKESAELTAKTHFNPPEAGRRRKGRHVLAVCTTKVRESRVICAM